MDELLERIKDFIKKIKVGEKICLVHHDDADGVCSAALFSILIHDLIKDYPMLFPIGGTESINKKLINNINSMRPDYVFVLDVTADPKKFYPFKGFVLDHHIFSQVEERKDMPYFNPYSLEKDDEKVPPVSCMVYRILHEFFPEEKAAWIAGIGITEDHRVKLCKDVFERIMEENPELLKLKVINQENVEKSLFGELWDMVKSGRMVKGSEGARVAVLALIECKDEPYKFVNGLTQHSSALRRFYEKVIYETQNCLVNVEKRGKFFKEKKVIFYEQGGIKLKGLTSFISDKIRQKYPDWIVCVTNTDYKKEKVKISIRLEQEKRDENLVSILEEIKKNIPSMKGGGHKSAVGVILNSEDLSEFKRDFLSLIKEKEEI